MCEIALADASTENETGVPTERQSRHREIRENLGVSMHFSMHDIAALAGEDDANGK